MLDSIGLQIGLPTKVVSAAVATGNARAVPFSVLQPPGSHKVNITQIGATVLTINPQQSVDGGTTWRNILAAAHDLIATPVLSFEVWPGIQYRFDIASLTTTPVDIYAVLY